MNLRFVELMLDFLFQRFSPVSRMLWKLDCKTFHAASKWIFCYLIFNAFSFFPARFQMILSISLRNVF